MNERLHEYFVMLGDLSCEELDRSARVVAVQEKKNTARLIAHITEIDDRRYHLELGYRSLFEYCVKRLHLSEGSVYRRIQVARVCRRFPRILEALSEGRLHLTGASLIAPHLSGENEEALITMARGKSKREIEELLVPLAPKTPFSPSLRKQPSRCRESEPDRPSEELPCAAPRQENGSAVTPTASRDHARTHELLEPATEDRYNFRFSAGRDFTEKFKRLAEVLGVECPQNHMEAILEQALECALEKRDPKRKLERRRKREARKEASTGKTEGQEQQQPAPKAPAGTPSRHVPSEIRERVLEGAGYRCEYCGPAGERCSCRTGLQVEHTKPFAVYGSHDEEHLRAYCAAHNLLEARRFYGASFIEGKIEAARRGTAKARACAGIVNAPA